MAKKQSTKKNAFLQSLLKKLSTTKPVSKIKASAKLKSIKVK